MSGFWNFEIYEHIYVVDDITYTYWTIKYLGLWVFIFKSEFCVYLKNNKTVLYKIIDEISVPFSLHTEFPNN